MSRYFNGQRIPNAILLLKIANALGVNPCELLDYQVQKEYPARIEHTEGEYIKTCEIKEREKIKVKSLEIIAKNTQKGKYYEIKYVKCLDGETRIGYSSYVLNYVLQWIAEYFDIMQCSMCAKCERPL